MDKFAQIKRNEIRKKKSPKLYDFFLILRIILKKNGVENFKRKERTKKKRRKDEAVL